MVRPWRCKRAAMTAPAATLIREKPPAAAMSQPKRVVCDRCSPTAIIRVKSPRTPQSDPITPPISMAKPTRRVTQSVAKTAAARKTNGASTESSIHANQKGNVHGVSAKIMYLRVDRELE